MKTDDLYLLADEDGIDVVEMPMEWKALSVYMNGSCAVAIDTDGMTDAEEKTALAHELGHCETLSFYNVNDTAETKRRCELRADRWAMEKLIPVEDLLDAFRRGIHEPWELAEEFNVTEELVRKTLTRYMR